MQPSAGINGLKLAAESPSIMKNYFNMFQKFLRSLLIIIPAFSCFTLIAQNCDQVDLQAVSISPVNVSLQQGKETQLEVVMRNNGPCVIAKGEATAQITLNTEHVEVPDNIRFSDECGHWTFLTSTSNGNLKNLFFRNNGS